MDQREKIKLTSGSSSVTHSGSRKPHRKVRPVVAFAKGRKIKCDENKPSCNNCIRHSVQCDIMTTSGAITLLLQLLRLLLAPIVLQ
ncbi:hypothetical protein DID88_008643 [Monilinia fructigena]|uniref:Zn(2)-C6 fungal-type domain-containing protein n=1 Tax=Monilinia fructigena TaxID=38457 RepID=A0A395J6Y9_9HELO|nr:hypothetical protein DID88_008643 [Monilinia fructigena]